MENIIKQTAIYLAIKFSDESDLPSRFKKNSKSRNKKTDLNSKIERNFKKQIESWTDTINSILKHVSDKELAWRFIRIKPKVENSNINSVTLCNDFKAFNNLLVNRRDIDNCSPDELGKLCMLLGAFQKEIEKNIIK